MPNQTLPFTKSQIEKLAEQFPTPFYLYDEAGIIESAKNLTAAFSWAPLGFRNYFAVKANPNPRILEILADETGAGADCSSLPELLLSKEVGIVGQGVMFTSNNTPANEFAKAREMNAIINLDDITHIEFLERHAGMPDTLSFRYNPGTGNRITGGSDAKFGLTMDQMVEAYRIAKQKDVKNFGLHTMVASNELNPQHFAKVADETFRMAAQISKELGIQFKFVNLGGGIGIPYKPSQQPADLDAISAGVKEAYTKHIESNGLNSLRVYMECGRLITGPHGYLITTVRHMMQKHKSFVGVDANMSNLMRPGMYGPEGYGYHHITVLGKETTPRDNACDVTGSLCENSDKFAVQRQLPKIETGDILVMHDAGAHGHSMGYQYNGKLRSAEILMRKDGTFELIRRAETPDDYFVTLNFPGSRFRV
ncbi:MAG TPA: diaminopimelate decarboxylase [Candidatus Nanoarchaeia archaeon]|nr:diaminopimelate decarboxylase [Candidatus Nanoarchaeia archaeon]